MESIYKLVLKREEVENKVIQGLRAMRNSEDIAQVVRELTRDEPQEVFLAFYLIGSSDVVGYSEIARGGFEWVTFDAKVLFSTALLCGATSIVVAHNHPSGKARPSRQDVKSMKKMIPAGLLLGIRVLDHVVVTKDQYVSMQEFGLLPPTRELIKESEAEQEKELDNSCE